MIMGILDGFVIGIVRGMCIRSDVACAVVE